MTKTLVRLAAVLTVALCTSACSTISDLIGDDTPASTAAADSNGFPPDTAPPAANADGTKPDLAGIPDRPAAPTTPDAQRETANSLAADATRSKYSSDALRGGTEAAAAPPPPPSADQGIPVASNPPPAPPPAPDNSANTLPPDNTAPVPGAVPTPAPTAPVASTPTPPPPGTQPAVPANGGVPGAQPMVMADASLGFKPSTAPPLDPSISQFVAPPIIARYQQTAANAGVATGPIAPVDGAGARDGRQASEGTVGGRPCCHVGCRRRKPRRPE